jgi:NAD(P)-dependent dehydrogenase (short-subunit alcohol dehydrogenase family)
VAVRVAVVTGGASGIGRACALAFADTGAAVAVIDADGDGAAGTADAIRESGGEALALVADVADSEAVDAAFRQIDERFGRVDAAVNSAGIQGALGETADCTDENWHRTLGINLTGTFLAMKHELHAMLRGDGGAIVNVASNFGLVAAPRMPAYAASKHGVIGLTKAAALDYATRGIRVNALCPGGTDTPMIHKSSEADPAVRKRMTEEVMELHPMRRWARPEEIAATALWLCSPDAGYVNGAAIAADGGYVAQ